MTPLDVIGWAIAIFIAVVLAFLLAHFIVLVSKSMWRHITEPRPLPTTRETLNEEAHRG